MRFTCFVSLFLVSSHAEDVRLDCDATTGWSCDYDNEFSSRNGEHAFCDVSILTLQDSLDTFLDECFWKKPCLINASLADWTNASFWTKDNLLAALGDYEFDSGESLELVLRAGVAQEKHTLHNYVQKVDSEENDFRQTEPQYIFDRSIWRKSESDVHSLDYNEVIKRSAIPFYDFAASKLQYNAAILAAGNTGTGATFHAHGENWLFLFSGRKRWFLYPPNQGPEGGFWPGHSSRDWFRFVYQKRDTTNGSSSMIPPPIECMQQPGQILYLPEFWWHNVINVGNLAVGAAVQTSNSRTPWMFERDVHDGVRRAIAPGAHNMTRLEEESKRLDGVYAYHRLSRYGPDSAVHHFFMGFELYDMGPQYFEHSAYHLKKALEIDAKFIEAASYLSRVYSLNRADNEEFDLAKAERVLRSALVNNPNNPSIRSEILDLLTRFEDMIKGGVPLPEI